MLKRRITGSDHLLVRTRKKMRNLFLASTILNTPLVASAAALALYNAYVEQLGYHISDT